MGIPMLITAGYMQRRDGHNREYLYNRGQTIALSYRKCNGLRYKYLRQCGKP